VSKIVVITGAGLGLGRAIARRLAADGETVVLLGRTASKVEALADELGSPAMAVECDVSSPDSVRSAFATIAKTHSKIDVLINNAAVYEPFPVAEARDDQIIQPILTNVAGPIYCTREAIPMMDRGAHIINISSESTELPFAMLSLYQTTKSGLERFSHSLGQELEEQGIRVTNVRAGQMIEEGKTSSFDPEMAMRFAMESAKRGVNLRERPLSHVNSVAGIFRTLIDLPPDLHVGLITLSARKAD
jgi:NAD(P)-dependent dehydrogenase (short-subunit alcohol dehydrogenase family)